MLAALVIATGVIAACAPVLGRILGRNAGWPLGAGLFAVGITVWVVSVGEIREERYTWMPSLGVEVALRLDGLSLLFALLVLLIGGVVLAYSARYQPPGNQGGYYGLMSLFAFAMLVLVLADDVVVMFVAWEITTLCSFFLIARSGVAARPPALRTLLVTAMGGLALLGAAVTMVVQTGTSSLSGIVASDAWADPVFAGTVATLLAVAAFTKSAQFPFQAWLPDAMAAATPVSAYLHAAAMVKAGIYLLMRFSAPLGDNALWNGMLITAGLITALLGAAAAIRSHDLKQLLAFSTVSQLGFLVAVIGVGTPKALTAASIHVVAHALFKSALFMLVGVINVQTGSRDVRLLSVLRYHMPVTATLVTVAALSMAGVPPLLGFISKESIFGALLEAPGPEWVGPAAAVTAVLVAIMTFAYSGRIVVGASGGLNLDNRPDEARASFLAPIALPAMAGLVVGLAPWLLDSLTSASASSATGTSVTTHLALWHGVNTALIMSALVIAVGTAMVLARRRIEAFLLNKANPISALAIVEWVRAAIIRAGVRVGDLTRSDSPTRHLAIPVLCVGAVAVVGAIHLRDLPAIVGDPTRAFDWVLVGLLVVGVVGAVRARGRVEAVAIIGVVGFGVTLWFYSLGAPDVATTQLLVEILTVVVIVMLLRRLPPTFHPTTRRRAWGAGAVAVVAGVASGLGVWALTGRREMSAAGEYFLVNAKQDTGGTNVVNTILVDYRALDTLGELTVLGIAGIAVLVLLRSRGLLPDRVLTFAVPESSPLADARANAVFGRTLTRVVGPAMIVISLWFLYRGHYEPGGGFIAALIGGAGFALLYLTAASDRDARVRWPYLSLIGGGVIVGTLSGVLGLVEGSFLRPLRTYVGEFNLTTAFLFDIGVYMGVVGVILASLKLLGLPRADHQDQPHAPVHVAAVAGREVKP